jgi:hypothetical protein
MILFFFFSFKLNKYQVLMLSQNNYEEESLDVLNEIKELFLLLFQEYNGKI